MAELRTAPLFTISLQVGSAQPIGATPGGNRLVGLVSGGTFEGARLKGRCCPAALTGSTSDQTAS